MPGRLDEFVLERVERGRRLLAESDDFRGSTDLQLFVEYMDFNERLHQWFLDDSGQRRRDLTAQQAQQGLVLLLRRTLSRLSAPDTVRIWELECYEAAQAAASRMPDESADAPMHLLRQLARVAAIAAMPALPDEQLWHLFPVLLEALRTITRRWQEHAGHAAELEQRQRAAGFSPVISAAQLRELTLTLELFMARELVHRTPVESAGPYVSRARASAAELLRLGSGGSAAYMRLQLAELSLDVGQPDVALYQAALAAVEQEKASMVAFRAHHGLKNALMVRRGGWRPAEVQQQLAGMRRSLKLAKQWVLPAYCKILRDAVRHEEEAVASELEAHPGRTTMPPAVLEKELVVARKRSKECCDCCGKYALQLRKCAACKQAAYCSRDCQVRHWKEGGHKAECRRLVAARQAGQGSSAGGSSG